MIDTLHEKYLAEYEDIKWEQFKKIKSKRGIYKAQIKNILFFYYSGSKTLLIILNAHRVLEKFDIKLSDLPKLQENINRAMIQIVDNYDKERLELLRCDFCS
jgi:hypothetical protein